MEEDFRGEHRTYFVRSEKGIHHVPNLGRNSEHWESSISNGNEGSKEVPRTYKIGLEKEASRIPNLEKHAEQWLNQNVTENMRQNRGTYLFGAEKEKQKIPNLEKHAEQWLSTNPNTSQPLDGNSRVYMLNSEKQRTVIPNLEKQAQSWLGFSQNTGVRSSVVKLPTVIDSRVSERRSQNFVKGNEKEMNGSSILNGNQQEVRTVFVGSNTIASKTFVGQSGNTSCVNALSNESEGFQKQKVETIGVSKHDLRYKKLSVNNNEGSGSNFKNYSSYRL